MLALALFYFLHTEHIIIILANLSSWQSEKVSSLLVLLNGGRKYSQMMQRESWRTYKRISKDCIFSTVSHSISMSAISLTTQPQKQTMVC